MMERDKSESKNKKVLLMGRSYSGKTSMRSIIFANYIARETQRLGPTMDYLVNTVVFMGNLTLNLWDCGGQAAFMESYFDQQKDDIFRNVEVLIYVFDVVSTEYDEDLQSFTKCIEAIAETSLKTKVFCLVHKMDLVPEAERDKKYASHAADVKGICDKVGVSNLQCFRTSIWDETLYKAWSTIVTTLIPNVDLLQQQLVAFADICEADEVVMFEKTSFLVICNSSRNEHRDVLRFEKISNIIKQFKLSCSKPPGTSRFSSLEVRTSQFTAVIDSFTKDSYVMVIMSDPDIEPAATHININSGRKHFEKLIQLAM